MPRRHVPGTSPRTRTTGSFRPAGFRWTTSPDVARHLWRRLRIIAVEDVGAGLPLGPVLVDVLHRNSDATPGEDWMMACHAVSLGETYLDLSDLGYLLLGTGRFTSAIDQFQRAMAVHDEVGDRWSTSRSMTGLALDATGAATEARSCWHEALAISEDLHDWPTAERIRALLAR